MHDTFNMTTQAGDSKSKSATQTASLLRRSSRLVHTLQKERGASCALCAAASVTPSTPTAERAGEHPVTRGTTRSSISYDEGNSCASRDIQGLGRESVVELNDQRHQSMYSVPSRLCQSVQQYRRDVDVALKSFLASVGRQKTSSLPLAKGLASIRKAVNAAAGVTMGTEKCDGARTRPDKNGDAQNAASGIAVALRKANLTPPVEVAEDVTDDDGIAEESGIGAALKRALEVANSPARSRNGSMDFGEQKKEDEEAHKSKGFHPILLMFNSLISTLIRIYIVEICHREIKRLGPQADEQGSQLLRVASQNSFGGGKAAEAGAVGGGHTGKVLPFFPPSPRGRLDSADKVLMGSPAWYNVHLPSVMANSSPMMSAPKPPPRPHGFPSSFSHNISSMYEPSIRDIRSRMCEGGTPSSDPSLFVMLPRTTNRIAFGDTRETESKAALSLLQPSLTRTSKKHTTWGSHGGFHLPPPTHVGSFERTAMAQKQAPVSRADSHSSIGSGNSGGDGSRVIGTFTSPSSKAPLASKSISLLSLLLSFTRLKESMGIERAVLFSLMALASPSRANSSHNDAKSTLPTMLFSDLVLEEENQRRIVRKLRSVALSGRLADAASALDGSMAYGGGDVNFQSLLKLVEDCVQMSDQMERVQDTIRRDFNLSAFHEELSMGEFWGLISMYMDRLHATELLIIAELECCLSNPIKEQDEDPRMNVSQHIDDFGLVQKRLSFIEVLREVVDADESEDDLELSNLLQELPAEELKEKLLAALSIPSANTADRDGEGDSVRFGHTELLPTSDETENSVDDNVAPSDHYIPSDWDIDPYEVEFRKRIGRGVAGTTYLATWSGQPVAVKVAAITDLGIGGWKTECESLRTLHHPNIVRMLGSIYNPNPKTFGLVLEYCESGDLKSALSRWTPPNFFWKIAVDISNGMAYLHKKGIIHRDLKPANILLHGDVPSANYQAKLADFGVAAMTQNRAEDEELTSETGTYRWMAPEVIRHESYSFMADVYSYGVVTWQLLTHEEPFAKHSQIEAAGMVALEHARPPFPHGTPQAVSRLIEICWSENPYDRIPFDEIRKELLDINKNSSSREKSWIETAFGHPVYEAPHPDSSVAEEDGNPFNLNVVKAMEKKSGGRRLARSKSWDDDNNSKEDGRWKFSLIRKNKK